MSTPREIAVLNLHQDLTQIPHPNFHTDSEEQSAFSKMLKLTSLRHLVSIKKILNNYISKKIPPKHQLAETCLICAVTEILFMDSPDYAIINSYVNIAKKHCAKFMSGFINAVLRNICKNKDLILSSYQQEFFPDTFKKILSSDYSADEITNIEQSSFTEPPLNICVKNNPQLWATKLNGEVITNNTISILNAGKISELKGYNDGEWWVQDISASLAVEQFNKLKDKKVLDLCAAPGGKTAQLINKGAKVTSVDCSQERLNILIQNLTRLHLQAEQIICADALEFLTSSQDSFDAILLDAPCSATGVFRRHPELVHSKTLKDIQQQQKLQQQILEKIPSKLKSGGELIYCTCSISSIEGEKQILDFIHQHPEFKISPLTNPSAPQCITPNGFIRTLPFHYAKFGGCDAFFIAKLIKDNK